MDATGDIVVAFLFEYRWYVATIVAAYLAATYRYWGLAREAAATPTLAPIAVKGGIPEQLGTHEAGLVVSAHLATITETFRTVTKEGASLYAGEAVGREFREVFDQVRAPLQLNPAEYPSEESEYKVREDLTVKVGQFDIPVGALWNLFLVLLRILPVPYRKRYEASLIRLSVVSVGSETQLLVYREGQPTMTWGRSGTLGKARAARGEGVLVRTAKVETLTDLTSLLRDASFLILQLDGKVFVGRHWASMRAFTDGLDALDEFRRTAQPECLQNAKESFRRAAESDPYNYDALYAHGSMLLMERTQVSIEKAIRVFRWALRTEKQALRALVNAGLANCYAQQFHRLAKREPEVLEIARRYADQAQHEMEATTGSRSHPLILAASALVRTVDEGTAEARGDARRRFLAAAHLYLQAIQLEPDNWRFCNNLGWVLLKLTQWGFHELKPEDGIPPGLTGQVPEDAQRYLHCALELNPANKLSHANLCLLYASDWYRKKDAEKYLDRCRYHGLKAVQLDPKYVNGYRDLAVSLLHYRQFHEAYEVFKNALRLADTPEKDEEVIADALSVLQEVRAGEKEVKRWRRPDVALLVPPEAASGTTGS